MMEHSDDKGNTVREGEMLPSSYLHFHSLTLDLPFLGPTTMSNSMMRRGLTIKQCYTNCSCSAPDGHDARNIPRQLLFHVSPGD